MKYKKGIKILSLILCAAAVITGCISAVYAYSTIQTDTSCGKLLCTKKLEFSGAYGNPDETVDSSVPYLGGRTFRDIFENEYAANNPSYIDKVHMYIIFCPKYSGSDSELTRHTMTVVFPNHGFTLTGYTPKNASTHTVNYVCDHNTDVSGTGDNYLATQELCGTGSMLDASEYKALVSSYGAGGCGKTKTVTENHTWEYSGWTLSGENTHQRTKTCSKCGYTETETESHDGTVSSWIPVDSSVHSGSEQCSVCGYNHTVTAEHNLTYSEWRMSDTDNHSRTLSCDICGYTDTETKPHEYTEGQWESISDLKHRRKDICSVCGFSHFYFIVHDKQDSFVPISETQHRKTTSCPDCGWSEESVLDHIDADVDGFCDDCGYMLFRFSVTVPAAMQIIIDSSGNVYTAGNAEITNNSTSPVTVDSVSVQSMNGWTLVSYDINMAKEKVDSKKAGLMIRDIPVSEDGTLSIPQESPWDIDTDSSLPLPYDAVISASSGPVSGEQIMTVTFIVKWRD